MIEAITPQSASDTTRWYEKCADLSDYVSSVQHEFPDNGSLRLLGAGKQGPEYTRNVASFDWNNFYDRYSGGTFLEALKYRIKTSYDYILIDCRTGITDLAGVCTVQLADDLVVCVSLKNRQSLEGAASVANSVTEQRRNSSFGDLRIFPVPARVELGEAALPDQAIEKAKRLFAPVTQHINNENYWNDVSVPYLPYFAFNEVPAPFVHERVGDELLKPAMRLTSYITDGRVSSFNPIPEDKQSR